MTFECVSPPSSNVIDRLVTDRAFNRSFSDTEYDINESYYGCFQRLNNGNSTSYIKQNTISRTNVGFTTSINF